MASTPAGWYPDPERPQQIRWWDGARWTEHFRPQPSASPQPAPASQDVVPAAESVDRGRGMLRAGVVLIVIALLTGGFAGVKLITAFIRDVTTPSIAIPADTQVELEEGRYIVYELTGVTRGGGGFTFTRNEGTSLRPTDVTLTAPSGQVVPVHVSTGANQTITQGSRIYTNALTFDAPDAGHYRLQVQGAPTERVLVARSIGDIFARAGAWLALGVVAFLSLVVGTILLVVHTAHRRRPAPIA